MAKYKFDVNTHVELSPDASRELYTLALLNKMTVADLVEKGIALMKVAYNAAKQGYRLAVVDDNGDLVADIDGVITVVPSKESPSDITNLLLDERVAMLTRLEEAERMGELTLERRNAFRERIERVSAEIMKLQEEQLASLTSESAEKK